MRRFLLFLILFTVSVAVPIDTASPSAYAQPSVPAIAGGIVINELLADPNGDNNVDTDNSGEAETGDEFIELFNNSDASIDISGFELWDRGNGRWFIFPPETILAAQQFALVIAGVQENGHLPALNNGSLAFDAEQGRGIIGNGGDNIVLLNPATVHYIQIVFNGADVDNPATDYDEFPPDAQRIDDVENWGRDEDGISIVRAPAGGIRVLHHNEVSPLNASPGFAIPSDQTPPPRLNEFVADHAGSDTSEYVEIIGEPDTYYSNYTILIIEGDGDDAGLIDAVFAIGETDANGIYVTPFMSSVLENGTLTILLVNGFTGRRGDRISAQGLVNGTLWLSVIDSVGISDGDEEDSVYSDVVLTPGFDGLVDSHPGGASRLEVGSGGLQWARNNYNGAGLPCCADALPARSIEMQNTPGSPNLPGE